MNSSTRFAHPHGEAIAGALPTKRSWLFNYRPPAAGPVSPICLRLLTLSILVGLMAPVATADTITFAQFQQATSGQPFVFTNSGATSTFDTKVGANPASVPVDFQFKVPNSYGPAGTNILAHLSMTSVVESHSLVVAGLAIQPLETINLTFTADTPVAGHSLLLEVTADMIGSTGVLYGSNLGHTANLAADTAPAIGNDFSFKSDFVSLAGASAENYALSFSSVTRNFSQAGNLYLNSFTAAGTGTFAAALVPEPASLELLALGGLALLALRRRSSAARTRAA